MTQLIDVSLINMAHHSKKHEEYIISQFNSMTEDVAYYIEKNKTYYNFVLNNKTQLEIFIKDNNLDKSYFFLHKNLSNILDCYDNLRDIPDDKYDTSLPSVTLKIKNMIKNIDKTYTVKNNSNCFKKQLNNVIRKLRLEKLDKIN